LKQHKSKDFWVSAIVFVGKDENLTKAHIRYLEGRLIAEAQSVGRYDLENSQSSGSRLLESDREDTNVFLSRIKLRRRLVDEGVLVERDGYLHFVRDAEFSSPSAAASVIHGGGANGLTEWRTELMQDGEATKAADQSASAPRSPGRFD
jgi:hypothetical protein